MSVGLLLQDMGDLVVAGVLTGSCFGAPPRQRQPLPPLLRKEGSFCRDIPKVKNPPSAEAAATLLRKEGSFLWFYFQLFSFLKRFTTMSRRSFGRGSINKVPLQ